MVKTVLYWDQNTPREQWNKIERTKINSHLDTTKGLKIYSEEKAFSINGVGKAGHSYMQKNETEPLSAPHTKINKNGLKT